MQILIPEEHAGRGRRPVPKAICLLLSATFRWIYHPDVCAHVRAQARSADEKSHEELLRKLRARGTLNATVFPVASDGGEREKVRVRVCMCVCVRALCVCVFSCQVITNPTPYYYIPAGHGDLRAGAVQLSPHLR